MVTTYKVHSQSKSCSKYNDNCRHNLAKFFSNQKIVVHLPDRISDDEKNIIPQKSESTLSTVQEYINEKLDPSKVNILNQRKANYKEVPSITYIFCELGITEDGYYNALSISND